MKQLPGALFRSIYRMFYEVVRRTPWLNHLAHKVMQSEKVNRFPPYRFLYDRMLRAKAKSYLRQPGILEITVTDMCNSRCIMCPPQVHMGKTIMDTSLFKDICRQGYALGLRKLCVTGGEPLLDKEIFDKIRFAKALGYEYIHMFTNASLLTEERSRDLLECGLDSLTWSIDSVDKEEYERIRIGLKFDTVTGNIREFMRLRQEQGRDKPLTRVNMVCLPENIHSRERFADYFAPMADIVELIDSHNWGGGFDVNSGGWEYTQSLRHPCHILFYKLCINPQGDVHKCSIDLSPEATIGDARTTSLADILNTGRLKAIKENHLRYDFSEPGCQECQHRESWWVDY